MPTPQMTGSYWRRSGLFLFFFLSHPSHSPSICYEHPRSLFPLFTPPLFNLSFLSCLCLFDPSDFHPSIHVSLFCHLSNRNLVNVKNALNHLSFLFSLLLEPLPTAAPSSTCFLFLITRGLMVFVSAGLRRPHMAQRAMSLAGDWTMCCWSMLPTEYL